MKLGPNSFNNVNCASNPNSLFCELFIVRFCVVNVYCNTQLSGEACVHFTSEQMRVVILNGDSQKIPERVSLKGGRRNRALLNLTSRQFMCAGVGNTWDK